MCKGDDRDTLLFGSISSHSLSEPNATPKDVAPLAAYAQPFPVNQPQACLALQCSSSTDIDRALESVAPLQQSNVQQRPACRHRHISLFASIELARPAGPPPVNERSPSSSARERFQKLTVSPGFERLNIQTPGSAIANRMGASLIACAAGNNASAHPVSNSACTHHQAPRTDAPSTFPKEQGGQSSAVAGANGEEVLTLQECDCALPNKLCSGGDNKPVDLSSRPKFVEACLTRLSNVDAHRFVAQELHEIHQMIQFRALRLRRQEEETSAAAAQATNALRQYAQQLLNQAAEKLARLATQQQKRTEATAEKAADILRRATEARCALRHERNMIEQLRRRQGVEQQLKLRTVSEALDAERRRCVDLEARVEVLQQENRQLRAALRGPLPQSRGSVSSKQLSASEPSSSRMRHHSLGCQPRRRCTTQQCPGETASLTAVVLPAVLPAKEARGGCLSCLRKPGKTTGTSERSTEAAGRQALVDVEVRLPPAGCSATAPLTCNETHAREADNANTQGGADRPQLRDREHPCPSQTDALPHHRGSRCFSRCWHTMYSTRHQKNRNRSAGSTAFRTDESTSSNNSMSSSNKLERRRRRRQTMRNGSARLHRSVSRWSVSTSSSSAASEPVARRRRSHSTRCAIPTPQYQRISFSVPQPGMQHPMEAGNDSSCSSVRRRSHAGGHKLALRQDVAGRLQASLMRLQGRQGKMQHIAKQLLDPQEL